MYKLFIFTIGSIKQTFVKGTKKVNWKDSSYCPAWWPKSVPFGGPNNSKPRLSSEQLCKVIAGYSYHVVSGREQASITIDDNGAVVNDEGDEPNYDNCGMDCDDENERGDGDIGNECPENPRCASVELNNDNFNDDPMRMLDVVDSGSAVDSAGNRSQKSYSASTSFVSNSVKDVKNVLRVSKSMKCNVSIFSAMIVCMG